MLDKSKPFGEVHGAARYAFTQDNKFFSGQGHEVDENGKLIEQDEAPIAPAKDARTELTEAFNKMTVDRLKEMLTLAEIPFDKKTVKAYLVAMLVDDELSD